MQRMNQTTDAARLDWLEGHATGVSFQQASLGRTDFVVTTRLVPEGRVAYTLRRAIDAAMEADRAAQGRLNTVIPEGP